MNTPHSYRRQSIHFWLLAPIVTAIISILLGSCRTQRTGCKSVRHMSGYGYIKNLETGRVSVISPAGDICYYWEKPLSKEEAQRYLQNKY